MFRFSRKSASEYFWFQFFRLFSVIKKRGWGVCLSRFQNTGNKTTFFNWYYFIFRIKRVKIIPNPTIEFNSMYLTADFHQTTIKVSPLFWKSKPVLTFAIFQLLWYRIFLLKLWINAPKRCWSLNPLKNDAICQDFSCFR